MLPAQPRPAQSEVILRNPPPDPAPSSENERSQISTGEIQTPTYGPSLPFLPNAGVVGPIPDDFDFERHTAVPGGISCFGLPLGIRIQCNVDIEHYNKESISQTVDVMATLAPRPPDMDIGPPLKIPYYYSESKIGELINSQTLCDSLGPLAPLLIWQITAAQAKGKQEAELAQQVEKDKEKEINSSMRGKLIGTMEMQKPI
ncbi:hypothetical protein C0992_011607 [Termitomyces sp. T32_za158]|nr:hypothetical protein C0992_011607 [Termitomyces sp. T32_za158]